MGYEPPLYPPSEWNKWMDDILAQGVNLTTWEEDFVESIRMRLDCHQSLSKNQEEVLERIYAQRTR